MAVMLPGRQRDKINAGRQLTLGLVGALVLLAAFFACMNITFEVKLPCESWVVIDTTSDTLYKAHVDSLSCPRR